VSINHPSKSSLIMGGVVASFGIAALRPRLGFVEVHAENYMGAGGPAHRYLAEQHTPTRDAHTH
jgi:hypothetical protein